MKLMKNNRQTSKLTQRRGNAMVLVVGILVLLVIIATSYIVRTNSGRATSSAQRRAMQRDDNSKTIADTIADILAQQLFARPYNAISTTNLAIDSNIALGLPDPNSLRYGVDPTNLIDNTTGFPPGELVPVPDLPYNFAPYHTVPWTNPPDGTDSDYLPPGPGNPGPTAGTINGGALLFYGNPVGMPGFGDNRPLADNEPLRWPTNPAAPNILDAYSHWRHMSNIATANNGWRIVYGINDIGDSNNDGIGRIISNLRDPVEQWLPVMPASNPLDPFDMFSFSSGNVILKDDFFDRWDNWFFNYDQTYWDPTLVPPNFYNLRDLDADGEMHFWEDSNGVPQESPQSEFIAGTARHAVNSVLADADGDGFTDSFWMLAPTMTESGIRQIVAVRIIDNSAMLNVNAGTRFVRADSPNVLGEKTRSVTPADLLLVGDIDDGGFEVGYFDNPQHYLDDGSYYDNNVIAFNPNAWDGNTNDANFLAELGVLNNSYFDANDNDQVRFNSAPDRLFYWQAAGSSPFDPRFAATPFGLTEELELRAYHGQNIPWIASRLERAIQTGVINGPDFQFLHANLHREETSELLEQLDVRELLFDHRKRLTTYSGARNDLMPPWLWWRWDIPTEVNALGLAAIDRFLAQGRKKLDLREMANPPLLTGEYDFAARLPRTLLLALIDGDEFGGNSYYGTYTNQTDPKYKNSRRAAAAYAANILQWSDDDTGYVDLFTATVPLPGAGLSTGPEARFIGIEKQPFLVEALIAHVHKPDPIGALFNHPADDIAMGDRVMCSTAPGSTIVVVQIANPFDEVLDLSPFQLSVFGQSFQLSAGPTLLSPGAARTYYAIEENFEGETLRADWFTLLNIDTPFDTVNVNDPVDTWSTDRSIYDSADETKAIEISRTIATSVSTTNVLVDRIYVAAPVGLVNHAFGTSVSERLRDFLPAGTCNETLIEGSPWPNVESIGPISTHWIQWSHVNRAWERDIDSDSVISPDERNPRYVFSYRNIDVSETNDDGYVGVVPDESPAKFDLKIKDPVPPASTLVFTMQMLQRDDDFEQVGELLNVFMFGHELKFDGPGEFTSYEETTQTFSEFMIDKPMVGAGVRVNRLRMIPSQSNNLGQIVGARVPPNTSYNPRDPLHFVPDLPAGTRVIDAFVCDGPGINGLAGTDDYLGAIGFSGKLTPALLNVNTAAQEVMRAIPHNSRLVHEVDSPSANPYVRVPEAIVRYRERFGDPTAAFSPPGYRDRGSADFLSNSDLDYLRGDRGFVSLAELLLLERPATFLLTGNQSLNPNENYRISFPGLDPYRDLDQVQSTRISIDLNDVKDAAGDVFPDDVSEDVEEHNLLFAGMSNLLTTRSDVFTVYFRIRSFRQNPVGPAGVPVWDATDLEFIVDDSRYVMLVDRSEVNKPSDKPKILYLERLAK